MRKLHMLTVFVIGLIFLVSCNKEPLQSKEAEVEITVAQVPQKIKDNINSAYVGCTMQEADKLIHPGGKVTYDVELIINGKTIEVMYDDEGTFLGEEREEGEEDEDEDEEDEESEKED